MSEKDREYTYRRGLMQIDIDDDTILMTIPASRQFDTDVDLDRIVNHVLPTMALSPRMLNLLYRLVRNGGITELEGQIEVIDIQKLATIYIEAEALLVELSLRGAKI